MIDSENRFVLSDKRSIIILDDVDDHIDNVVQNARGKCPKDSYESGTFKCDPSLSDAAKSDEPKEFKELTSEYFSELGGFHVTKYQGMKEFIIRGHNKDDNKVVLDAISKLSKEDQGKMPDFTIMGIKEKSKYLPKLHTLGLQKGLSSNEVKQEIEKHLGSSKNEETTKIEIPTKILGVKPSWQGIAKEALKYDDFEKYSTAWVSDNMFGKYWHITDNPDFKIDPEKGPRDMSSMGSGKGEKGKLMVSSVPEHWVDQYPNRKYIAEIDLSDVPKDKYSPVRRGFGQEIMIEDPSKARVMKVYPIKDGLRAFGRYFDNLPQSEEELRGIWEKAHQAIKQNSEYVEPIEVRLNYKCPKGTKDPNTNECGIEKPGKSVKQSIPDIYKMNKKEFSSHIKSQREKTFSLPEVKEAIENTEGAKITKDGLELTIVRYQEPEQAGSLALRGAVFYLPEKNSPYKKYYSGRKNRYGGTERFEGKTVYRNPLIIKGATGGTVPERAYIMISSKEKLKELQGDISKTVARSGFMRSPTQDHVSEVAEILEKYGGDRGYAIDIVNDTQEGGNLERYAIQEHIIAAAVKKAGYDGVIGFTKMKGKMHLSEVLDVRTNENPFQDNWEDDYESYYDDFYDDNIKIKRGSKG